VELGKIKVGVLGGGISAEREISLVSAKGVHQALIAKGFNADLIDISTSQEAKIKEVIKLHNIALAFVALHGEFGEDGKIQSILEDLGLTYTGSGPKASLRAMDKALSKDIFLKNHIPTPEFFVCSDDKGILSDFGYPLVVKPVNSGSSLGVSIVNSEAGLKPALKKAFSYNDKIIVEKYIEGREITVGILDDRALGVVEIVAKEGYYDFDTKYSDGKADFIVPAKLEDRVYKEIQRVGLAAHKALGCRHFSRADIRLGNDGIPYVLEVNSIPGLTSHSLLPLSAKVCGVSYDDLIVKMLELALYGKKRTKTQKV